MAVIIQPGWILDQQKSNFHNVQQLPNQPAPNPKPKKGKRKKKKKKQEGEEEERNSTNLCDLAVSRWSPQMGAH